MSDVQNLHGLAPLISEASTAAIKTDALTFAMLGLCGVVLIGVMFLLLYFSTRYRRGREANREPIRRFRPLEYTWTAIPMLLFTGIFVWANTLYMEEYSPPRDAMPIYVVAKQWMWKLQHPGGKREINELHVPLDRPVQLVMTSEDVIHSFYVPAFRLKQDVVPGRYTTLWFRPVRTGRYYLFCAEYCGTDHADMRGVVTVLEPEHYAAWLATGTVSGSMAQQGAVLFRQSGCSGCHAPNAAVHAPPLAGLYGRSVPLGGGEVITADERYIHDSIVQPTRQIVAGYAPIMPSFEGQLSEEQILQIIEYIKSLQPGQGVTP